MTRIAVLGVGPDRRLDRPCRPAARREREVAGWDPDPRALERALERGAIDESCADRRRGARRRGDLFRLRAGERGARDSRARRSQCGGDCVVTDVGSDEARRARGLAAAGLPDPTSIGSSAGIRSPAPKRPASTTRAAELFEGATWYLTPTERTGGLLYERLYRT